MPVIVTASPMIYDESHQDITEKHSIIGSLLLNTKQQNSNMSSNGNHSRPSEERSKASFGEASSANISDGANIVQN